VTVYTDTNITHWSFGSWRTKMALKQDNMNIIQYNHPLLYK